MTVEGRAIIDVRFLDSSGTSAMNTLTMNVVVPMNGEKVATFSGVVTDDMEAPSSLSLYPAGAFTPSGSYRNASGDEVYIETLLFSVVQNDGGSTIYYTDGFSNGVIPEGKANIFLRTIEGNDDSGNWPYMYTTAGTASYTAIVYGT